MFLCVCVITIQHVHYLDLYCFGFYPMTCFCSIPLLSVLQAFSQLHCQTLIRFNCYLTEYHPGSPSWMTAIGSERNGSFLSVVEKHLVAHLEMHVWFPLQRSYSKNHEHANHLGITCTSSFSVFCVVQFVFAHQINVLFDFICKASSAQDTSSSFHLLVEYCDGGNLEELVSLCGTL